MTPVPKTSARRGKRIKVIFGCRQCRREHRAHYLSLKYSTPKHRSLAGLRHYCNGVFDT